MMTKRLLSCSVILLCFSISSLCAGQQGPISSATMFPPPMATGIIGQIDPGAVLTLKSFAAAVGTGYQDLSASGTIFYPAQGAGTPGTVSLLMSGGSSVRLDTQTAVTTRSLRISGSNGAFQVNDGGVTSLPATAATAGLFGFTRLLAVYASPGTVSLFDQGLVSIAGTSLHRITLEQALVLPASSATDVATDFYFDPASSTLLFSVDTLANPASTSQPHVRVISYSGWNPVSNLDLPTQLAEYLDDQQIWTIQLTSEQLNTGLNPSLFTF